MDLRNRQRLGYLTAGLVVLVLAVSVGSGYLAGYLQIANASSTEQPRPLPANVCDVLSKSTQLRLVPGGVARGTRVQEGATRTTARCGLVSSPRNAITYNEGKLRIRVDRYGGEQPADRTRAAEQAMTEILNDADPAGKAVKGLGNLSWVVHEELGQNHWHTHIFAQQRDVVISVDYTTWLGNGRDTRKAAIGVTDELFAGLS